MRSFGCFSAYLGLSGMRGARMSMRLIERDWPAQRAIPAYLETRIGVELGARRLALLAASHRSYLL
jgi:hypothetical protein